MDRRRDSWKGPDNRTNDKNDRKDEGTTEHAKRTKRPNNDSWSSAPIAAEQWRPKNEHTIDNDEREEEDEEEKKE